ncbi:MAG: hypothetical protein GXP49_11560, partial [Deltaproteobacteria bacterium]|nr:hypothetical protein [Deltaproteobacteria bacterium]
MLSCTIMLISLLPGLDNTLTREPGLEEVQQAIESQGLDWQAGETPVSSLKPEEFRKLLIPPSLMEKALASFTRSSDYTPPQIPATGLPDALDWRNRGGVSFITPVRDQAQCGSCWAFGSLAAVESIFLIRNKTPFDGTNDVDLSEQDIIDCSDSGGCNGGGTWGKLPAYLENYGVSYESCYPYKAADNACRAASCTDRVKTQSHVPIALLGPMGPDDRKIIDRLRAEIFWRPVPVSLAVYSDFRFYKSGVYMESQDATIEGYHAVSLIGWNEKDQAWIVKNSWGPDWGENGFFRIKYWASGIGSMAMRFEMQEQDKADFCNLPANIELDPKHPERFRMLRLENCGGAPGPWIARSDKPWLSIEPGNGEIVPGGHQDIKLEYTGSGPKDGESALLHIQVT